MTLFLYFNSVFTLFCFKGFFVCLFVSYQFSVALCLISGESRRAINKGQASSSWVGSGRTVDLPVEQRSLP